jgi:hypothetical protein
VTSTGTEGGCDAVGVLSIYYLDQVKDRMALIAAAWGDPADMVVSDVLVNMRKSGASKTITVEMKAANSNDFIYTDRRLLTNDLTAVKEVCENLSRTMYIVTPSALIFTNGNTETTTFSTNLMWDTDIGEEGLFGQVLGESSMDQVGSVQTNNIALTNGGFNGVVFQAAYNGDYLNTEDLVGERWDFSPNPWVHGSLDTYATISRTRLSDCRLNYPSDFAFKSNYVSKIVVFAVGHASTAEPMRAVDVAGLLSEGVTLTDYTPDPSQPSHYDEVRFGILSCLAEYPTPESSFQNTTTRVDIATSRLPSKWKLAKIIEEENPSAFPVFNFGAESVGVTDLLPYCQRESYQTFFDNPQTPETHPLDYDFPLEETVTSVHKMFEDTITIDYFVVMVDWNFRHFNKETPFTPATMNNPNWTKGPIEAP